MTEYANFEKCNLIWTSWYKKKISDKLIPSKNFKPEHENKIKIYSKMD